MLCRGSSFLSTSDKRARGDADWLAVYVIVLTGGVTVSRGRAVGLALVLCLQRGGRGCHQSQTLGGVTPRLRREGPGHTVRRASTQVAQEAPEVVAMGAWLCHQGVGARRGGRAGTDVVVGASHPATGGGGGGGARNDSTGMCVPRWKPICPSDSKTRTNTLGPTNGAFLTMGER